MIDPDRLPDGAIERLVTNVLYWVGVHPQDYTFRTPRHEMIGGVRMALRQLDHEQT
jgi:hypothetical protein